MAQIIIGASIHLEGNDIVVGDITTGSITRGNTVSTHTVTTHTIKSSRTVIGHNDGTLHRGDGDVYVNGHKRTK
ncbi:hypothetical protein [Streptosporangium sp. NPDC023615]|uniref:hypothetical protein n=1 Tax=Streptosporangium sp. NPDC023615 TaxID=3154794 RepID=UPI003440E1FF